MALVALAACASPTAFDRGLTHLRGGRYAQAQADFDETLGTSAAALANRGVARARQGDLDGAIEDYTRALELAPEDADPVQPRQRLGREGRVPAGGRRLHARRRGGSGPRPGALQARGRRARVPAERGGGG